MLAILSNNWIGIALFGVSLLMYATYHFRGFVDFLKGLKPIKEGWVGLVEKVNSIAEKVENLAENVENLNKIVRSRSRSGFAESNSPTQLNEEGRRVANLINVESLVEKYASQIKVEETESAYSIQQKCFEFALEKLPNLLTKDEVRLIEDIAFNEGVEKSIILDVVFGISLRNKILSDKQIPLKKVD